MKRPTLREEQALRLCSVLVVQLPRGERSRTPDRMVEIIVYTCLFALVDICCKRQSHIHVVRVVKIL